jgi:hypothetical protein
VLVDVDIWAGDIHAGSLPQICVFTGEATRGVHSVRYSTFPRWVWALLFAGILPFFVGVLLTRRAVTGSLPMGVRALRRFVVQRAAGVVIVAVIPALFFIGGLVVLGPSPTTGGSLLATSFLVLFVGGIVCTIWGGAISISGSVEDRPGWGRWVRLRGVNPTFAAAVQHMYAARMPQWQIGTVPTSFANVTLPEGYGPPMSPPGWLPPPWNAAVPVGPSPPPAPPAAR